MLPISQITCVINYDVFCAVVCSVIILGCALWLCGVWCGVCFRELSEEVRSGVKDLSVSGSGSATTRKGKVPPSTHTHTHTQ